MWKSSVCKLLQSAVIFRGCSLSTGRTSRLIFAPSSHPDHFFFHLICGCQIKWITELCSNKATTESFCRNLVQVGLSDDWIVESKVFYPKLQSKSIIANSDYINLTFTACFIFESSAFWNTIRQIFLFL